VAVPPKLVGEVSSPLILAQSQMLTLYLVFQNTRLMIPA
jgi:hypothetical protein